MVKTDDGKAEGMTSQCLKSQTASIEGKLIVFEGADGVGKTTVTKAVFDHLQEARVKVERLAFPGDQVGTVGRLVHDIHHQPKRVGVDAISPASLQTLHVAAHVDAIQTKIIPVLNSGACVLLDRFWWSTWVYGIVAGVPVGILRPLIQFERSVWGTIRPALIVHLVRPGTGDRNVVAEYERLARREANAVPVVRIATHHQIDATRCEVMDALMSRVSLPARRRN